MTRSKYHIEISHLNGELIYRIYSWIHETENGSRVDRKVYKEGIFSSMQEAIDAKEYWEAE